MTAIIPYDYADILDEIRLAWEYEDNAEYEVLEIAFNASDETLYRLLNTGDEAAARIALYAMGLSESRRFVFTLRQFCNHPDFGHEAERYLSWIEPVTKTPDVMYAEPPLPLFGYLVKVINESPTGEKEKVF